MADDDSGAQASRVQVQVYAVAAIAVVSGANQGDMIGHADLSVPGDIYRLDRSAHPIDLILEQAEDGRSARIHASTDDAAVGRQASLMSRLTFMATDGERVEVLLVALDGDEADFVLPLSPLAPGADYTLLEAHADPGEVRLGDILCASLARGTSITLPGGARRPVETLTPGTMVLTRDHGAQPLRWIGRARLRANGAFAPVVIAAGTLGNSGDLVVGQHHRIFIYQRGSDRLGRRAALLVQAKHLVDGDRVFRREGGFADYYSLAFDNHEIIYAEGIPCESLLVNEATLRRLPDALAEDVRDRFPGLSQTQHFGTELGRDLADHAPSSAILDRFRRPG